MVGFVCILVLASVAVFAFVKMSATVKRLSEASDGLVADRSALQNRVDALEFELTAIQGECQRLTRRLLSVEAELSKKEKQPESRQPEAAVESRSGTRYFANVINSGQGYFRGLLNEPDYTAKFVAKADEADPINIMHFEPIDLKTLLSNDGLDKAITIVGDVPAEEARSLLVELPGVANLVGSRWIIVSPCKVSFIR
ncbi:MAG: hypothetical protein J1E84_02260 [Muribaculaceae bacterium]|nr:hypothetical protein [Muribaculaceae bacterium]